MHALDPIDARVVGSLIEKALTTPDQYPLSLSALLAACNQKSNRNPVMRLTEEELLDALARLRSAGWVTIVMPSSGRVERYRRHVREVLGVDGMQEAILAELLLRGPQTAGELRTRCARMKPFDSLETAQSVLRSLETRQEGEALVKRLPPEPGGRAERWMTLLTPLAEADQVQTTSSSTPVESGSDVLSRLLELERRVERVEEALRRVEQP